MSACVRKNILHFYCTICIEKWITLIQRFCFVSLYTNDKNFSLNGSNRYRIYLLGEYSDSQLYPGNVNGGKEHKIQTESANIRNNTSRKPIAHLTLDTKLIQTPAE
jgi:hypothetical protein